VLLAVLAGTAACTTNASPIPRPTLTSKPIVNFPCGNLEIGMEPKDAVAGLRSGRIVPGLGVANIDLGMTRDQVIAKVGPPVCEVGSPGSLGEDIWDFAPVTPNSPHMASKLLVFFDKSPDSDPNARVVDVVAAGSGFQLEDGSPAFLLGSYDRFTRLYPGRITASGPDGSGNWKYQVSPDPGGTAGAVTTFTGESPGPSALDLGTVGIQTAQFPFDGGTARGSG
jgi:hypothetical protein